MREQMGSLIGKTMLAFIMLFSFIIVFSLVFQGLSMGDIATPLGLGLTSILMYWLVERRKDWGVGWQDRNAGSRLLTGILVTSIVFAVTMVMMLWTGTSVLLENSWRREELIYQVFLFLLVAIAEEWLFRGYLFGLYKSIAGIKTAIVLNSILFTALHLLNPNSLSRPLEFIFIEMVNIFLLALCVSFAREYSGSLWMPIGIHFTLNFLQSTIFGFLNGGKQMESLFHFSYERNNLWNGAGYGLESSMVYTIVLLITVLLFSIAYILFKRRSQV